MKYYGLRLNLPGNKYHGNLAGFWIRSNGEAAFASDVEIELTASNQDRLWAVKDRCDAEHAAEYHTEWYNSGYRTPGNPHPGKWDVVEFQL